MTQSSELPLTATQSDDLTATFVARLKAHLASPATEPERDIPPWDDPEEDDPSDQAPGLIPARSLLICLRLAASFGTAEAILPLTRAGAVTVLRGFGADEAGDVAALLKIVLPQAEWRVLAPSIYEGGVTKSSLARFQRDLDLALDLPRAILILLPTEAAQPAHLLQAGATLLTYAPLSAQILLDFLTALGRRPADVEGFLHALPGEEALAQLEVAQLVPALRLGFGGDLPQRLHALTTPAPEGPSLDTGFADSPALHAAQRLVADLLAWRRGEIGWGDFSHSLLLYGPPGTGKTWLALAMGNSAGIACVKASFAEWQAAGHLGEMLAAMRKSFAAARHAAPALLFIDEIDAVGSRQSGDRHNENYRANVINGFLGEMNSLALEPGVIVVGACNHPDRIDPAVTRAGRFDLKFEVPMPDADAILAVLQQHLGADFPQDSLERLARQAVGQSLAAIDAAIRAARSEARHASMPLDLAMLRDQLRLTPDPAEDALLWRHAVHEAGHAVVVAALHLGTIERMSISRQGGEVARRPSLVPGLLGDLENDLCLHLAGRAAEALILGEVSAGSGGSAASDLAQATTLALAIETTLGLGSSGLLWLDAPQTHLLTEPSLQRRISARLTAAEARAQTILSTHKAALIGLAEEVLAQRSLRAEDVLPWVHAVQSAAARGTDTQPEGACP